MLLTSCYGCSPFIPPLEKIGTFLQTYVAKDIEQDLAHLDLDGDETEAGRRGLKYMDQLVRVVFGETRRFANPTPSKE